MKISIIVPVYNCEKYLYKLYNSIAGQTYDNYEIIFVNDGSTDNSLKILKKIKNENDKVKIFSKENEGPGLTRKYGFKKSTGDLLFFVDSDDWLPNNDVLSEINYVFENYNIDLLLFDREIICDGEVLEKLLPCNEFVKQDVYSIELLEEHLVRSGLGSKVFKRNMMKDYFFIESNNFEDFYVTYSYINECSNLYILNKTLYYINRDTTNNSLSKKMNFDKFYQTITNSLKVYDLSNNIIKNSISYVFLDIFFHYIYLLVHFKFNIKEFKLLRRYIRKIKKIIKNKKCKEKIKNVSLKRRIMYFIFVRW